MDKGQGSRNQIAKIEEFKGYVTSVDSPAIGIDVAEEMINVAYDLDGGIRKREGIKQDTSFVDREREKILFVKSRQTKTSLEFLEDTATDSDTNILNKNSFKILKKEYPVDNIKKEIGGVIYLAENKIAFNKQTTLPINTIKVMKDSYTNISINEASIAAAISLTGYKTNVNDWNNQNANVILYFSKTITLTPILNLIVLELSDQYDNTGFAKRQVTIKTATATEITFQAGKYYLFEIGKDPVEVKENHGNDYGFVYSNINETSEKKLSVLNNFITEPFPLNGYMFHPSIFDITLDKDGNWYAGDMVGRIYKNGIKIFETNTDFTISHNDIIKNGINNISLDQNGKWYATTIAGKIFSNKNNVNGSILYNRESVESFCKVVLDRNGNLLNAFSTANSLKLYKNDVLLYTYNSQAYLQDLSVDSNGKWYILLTDKAIGKSFLVTSESDGTSSIMATWQDGGSIILNGKIVVSNDDKYVYVSKNWYASGSDRQFSQIYTNDPEHFSNIAAGASNSGFGGKLDFSKIWFWEHAEEHYLISDLNIDKNGSLIISVLNQNDGKTSINTKEKLNFLIKIGRKEDGTLNADLNSQNIIISNPIFSGCISSNSFGYKTGMWTEREIELESTSHLLAKITLNSSIAEPNNNDEFVFKDSSKNVISTLKWSDIKSQQNFINQPRNINIKNVKYIYSNWFSKLGEKFNLDNIKISEFVLHTMIFPEVKDKAKKGEIDFKYSDYVVDIERIDDNKSKIIFYKIDDEKREPIRFATSDGIKSDFILEKNEDSEYSYAVIGDSIVVSTGKNIYSFIPIKNSYTDKNNVLHEDSMIVAGTLDEFSEDVSYEESVITGLNRLGSSPLLMVKDESELLGFDFGVKDVIITDDYRFFKNGEVKPDGKTADADTDYRTLSIVKEPNKDHYAFSQITVPAGFDKTRLNYEWTLFQLGDDQQWKEMKGSTLGWKGSVELNKTNIVNNIPGAWTINIKDDLKDRTTDKAVPWNLGENKRFTIIITASKIGDTTSSRNYTLEGDVKVDESGLHYKFYTYGNLSTNDRFEGTLDKNGNLKLFRVLDGTHAAELENLNIIGVSQYQEWEVGISYPDMTKVIDNKTSGTTFSKVATGKETFIKIDSYALNASTSYQLQLKVSYDETQGSNKRVISQMKIINFVVKSREIGETVSDVKSLWDEMKTCKYVANFDDKLVLYGNGTQQIYTSELGRPYFITAEEIVKADSFGKGEDIVSIQNFKDTKIIFTKSTMMSMTGAGNTEANDPYHVLPLDGAVGCVGHLAVTPIENTLAFVGKDGIYMIEQISVAEQRVQLAKISSQINKEALPYFDIIDKVDEQLFSDIVAINLEQRLIISYPQKEYMLVFDYGTDGIEKGKWSKWISNIIPVDFLVKENVLYMLDYIDNTKVFIKQPKITNDIYDQEYPSLFFTDAKVPYEFKYVSKYSDLGLPYEAKKIKRIFTATDNKWDGNVSYDVKFLADGYENINYHVNGNSYNRPLLKTGIQWGSLTTFRESHNIHSHIELISKPGRTIRMIIINNNDEPFALKGVQLEFTYSKAKGKQISK